MKIDQSKFEAKTGNRCQAWESISLLTAERYAKLLTIVLTLSFLEAKIICDWLTEC